MSRKLERGQEIYLWCVMGDKYSDKREYRVEFVGPAYYHLRATDNGERTVLTDSYPDLDDKGLQILERLDDLVSK